MILSNHSMKRFTMRMNCRVFISRSTYNYFINILLLKDIVKLHSVEGLIPRLYPWFSSEKLKRGITTRLCVTQKKFVGGKRFL